MNRQETKLKRVSELRFGSVIFLFRLAGISLKVKKTPVIYNVYIITAIICSCSAYIGMLVDAYVHRDDLGRVMTTIRMLIPFTNTMWIFSYCR
jgi:hypothetical protein